MTGPIAARVSGSVAELGSAGWIVVEFRGGRFTGKVAPALGELAERGIVRVPDLLLTREGEDGTRASASPAASARARSAPCQAAVVACGVRRRGDWREDREDRREDRGDRRW